MEETSKELPNFSIGIDLLGPDPTSNKNKAEKNLQVACFANLLEDQLQQILALIFTIFPINFELFIQSYQLTGSNVLARTKVLTSQ